MTVSHGVEGQLISEARICIYSDIKALNYGESDGNNIFYLWDAKGCVWGFLKRALLQKTAWW